MHRFFTNRVYLLIDPPWTMNTLYKKAGIAI